MQVLTDDVPACVVDFDTNGRITGDQVHGEFTTDASGTLGITLNAISDMQGNEHADRGKPPSCTEHFEVCHRIHR
jgi:hypothetical protein